MALLRNLFEDWYYPIIISWNYSYKHYYKCIFNYFLIHDFLFEFVRCGL